MRNKIVAYLYSSIDNKVFINKMKKSIIEFVKDELDAEDQEIRFYIDIEPISNKNELKK